MRSRAEVVIIGGGIQGASVVYHLAKKGTTDTVLVEMDLPGSGSSGRTAAMLMHQTGREQTTQLAQISIAEYFSYRDEFGVDHGLHKTGSICYTTDVQLVDQIRSQVDMQNRVGIETHELDGSGVREKVPIINVDDLLVAAYCPLDGYVDPYSVVQWYIQNARDQGAEINPNVEALDIQTSKHAVVGVETTKGFIQTRTVINAAGAKARQVGKWLGIDLPIKNRKRSIILLAPRPPVDIFPIAEDVGTGWYLKPEGRNIMVGVGPQTDVDDIPDTLQPGFEVHRTTEVAEFIAHRVPYLINTDITPMKWAGIRCMTPDELPILGPVDEVEGFLNCCGWSGFGVTLAPVSGKLLAELIADGKAATADINPFLLERFQSKSK